MIKNIAVSAVVALIVSIGVAGLIGDQSGDNLGAVTRMPNVDFVAKSLTASTTSTTATSTISVMGASATQGGQVIVKDADGAGCTSLGGTNGTAVTRVVTCP
jgi:hypothetical protein